MKISLFILLSFFFFIPFATSKTITIFHTNDWHSRLLGFAPESEYHPEKLGDGTVGGIARLATLIDEKEKEASKQGPVLLVDSGDFSMGTLFQTIDREEGIELQLFNELHYDVLSLGNHEFDYRPAGLAQMIRSGLQRTNQKLPPILNSNMLTTESDPKDAEIRKLQNENVIRRYYTVARDGMKIGFFSLIGDEAAENAAEKDPITFQDPVKIAKEMVTFLRYNQHVDYVILLSHCGVKKEENGTYGGEEVELAKQVPGIDVIIGGHSHTPLFEAVMVGNTPIVQAGSDGRYLGELQLEQKPEGGLRVVSYHLNPVNDKILGNPHITQLIETWKGSIDKKILTPIGYNFNTPVLKIDEYMGRTYEDHPLGYFVTTAIQKAAGADIGFIANGLLRDDLNTGKQGVLGVSDLFRIIPLGLGLTEDTPGDPVVKFFLTGKDLKSVLEVLLFGYKIKSDAYFPRFSGLVGYYDPYRIPLDRVFRITLLNDKGEEEEIDLTNDTKLYSVATVAYIGKFIWLISSMSQGLLSIVPKDVRGVPIFNLADAVLKNAEGDAEMKAWKSLFSYMNTFPKDPTHFNLPYFHSDQNSHYSPLQEVRSMNPKLLLLNSTWIEKTSLLVGILLFLLTGFMSYRMVFRRRKSGLLRHAPNKTERRWIRASR